MRRAAAVIQALTLALAASAAAALELEGGVTHEELTKDKPDWDSFYIEGAHDFAPRQTLYGALRDVERFDARDTELAAAYYQPFNGKWTGQFEASVSPDHNVLPEGSVLGQFAWAPGGALSQSATRPSPWWLTSYWAKILSGARKVGTTPHDSFSVDSGKARQIARSRPSGSCCIGPTPRSNPTASARSDSGPGGR